MGPPADISPERLFRFLLRTPRPTAPLRWRLPSATDLPLHVRAITSLEELAVYDDAAGLPGDQFAIRVQCARAAASVWSPVGPLFDSGDAVAELDGPWCDALVREVSDALDRISPSYVSEDVNAWLAAVKRGAEHHSNYALVAGLAFADSPAEYFGALGEMTDGAWMAYRAAVKVSDARRKSA